MQNRYWNYMQEKRCYIYYMDMFVEYSYKLDKCIRMASAVTSSAGIAAWAVWQQYSYVWAAIIAFSQVVNAVKDILPYSKRLKYMAPFIKELKLLYNKIEFNWFQVSSGSITEEEMNRLLYNFENEFIEMENEHLVKEALPNNKRFMKKAKEETDIYFQRFFNVSENKNEVFTGEKVHG